MVNLKIIQIHKDILKDKEQIVKVSNSFSDFCNMRYDSLEYRGIVNAIDGIFLSALTKEDITDNEKNLHPYLDFIKTSYGYEIKAYLVKVEKWITA